MRNVSVIGLGYVGLTLSCVLASKGISCIAVDNDKSKLQLIQKGKVHFFEPSLDRLLSSSIRSGRLKITNDIEGTVINTDTTFVTVGTPRNKNGTPNLSQLKSVCISIGKALRKKSGYHIVIIKSTVPPTTTSTLVKDILEKESRKRVGTNFGLVTNPEFLREGSAVDDTLNPHVVVIGSWDKKAGDQLESFYKKIYKNNKPPIIRTNPSTAEIIKYANNAFLATKISFINCIANICQRIPRTDVQTVGNVIGLDPRIGSLFLKAGPGYGGSCLPKDLDALATFSEKRGYNPRLLKAVKSTNTQQSHIVVKLAKEMLGNLQNKEIAILGLAFKKNTNDVREAPSIKIIKKLLKEGAIVSVHDPLAIDQVRILFNRKVRYAASVPNCIDGTDCCILVTDWDEYKLLEPKDFKKMRNIIIIDARRILDLSKFTKTVKFAALGVGNTSNSFNSSARGNYPS